MKYEVYEDKKKRRLPLKLDRQRYIVTGYYNDVLINNMKMKYKDKHEPFDYEVCEESRSV